MAEDKVMEIYTDEAIIQVGEIIGYLEDRSEAS